MLRFPSWICLTCLCVFEFASGRVNVRLARRLGRNPQSGDVFPSSYQLQLFTGLISNLFPVFSTSLANLTGTLSSILKFVWLALCKVGTMQPSRVEEARPQGPTSSLPRQSAATMHPSLLPTPPTTPSQPAIQIETHGAAIRPSSPNAKMSSNSHYHTSSHASIDTNSSHRSRKEYMDSLVPPSSAEMARIAEVQLEREKEEKRKSREKDREIRRSMDLARSSLESHHEDKPRRGSILGSLLHHHNKHTPAENHSRQSSIAITAAEPPSGDNILMQRAATLIQKTYRGYKTRREMKGLGLDADTRWTHAIRELRFREMVQPRGKNDVPVPVSTQATQEGLGADSVEAKKKSSSARYKWKKVATIAARAAADMDDDDEPTSSSDSDQDPHSDHDMSMSDQRKIAHQKREEAKVRRRKDARIMGLQYFLEMVDLKHRYGSNLRTYHEEWKKADTKEPFFYWLDFGQGRNLDMATCPRERLDREQVRYLSREERLYYLVKVDAQGRLCWAKNGMRIDTTEEWKDSIHGIVPVDDPTPAFKPVITNNDQPKPLPNDTPRSHASGSRSNSRSSAISNASSSELEAARAAKYASPGFTDAKGYKKVTHISASTIFNTLLRKSVRKNTWIFVADTSFRLYVGIKDSGAFQHSSFVQGSRISAAGLIKIKNGRLASLSPLSGHYRPPASNFRAFVHSLKEEGVDMSHVSISKSYAVLVGLEMYMKTQQKGKRLLEKAVHQKDKLVHPEIAQKREEDARDTSQSAEKERQFLERQRAEQLAVEDPRRDVSRSTVKVMQKLGINPAVTETRKGEGVTGMTSEKDAEKVLEQVESEERAEAAGESAASAADEAKR